MEWTAAGVRALREYRTWIQLSNRYNVRGVSSGLRTNRKSWQQSLEEEWRSSEAQMLELQPEVFSQRWFVVVSSVGVGALFFIRSAISAASSRRLLSSSCFLLQAALRIYCFHTPAGPEPEGQSLLKMRDPTKLKVTFRTTWAPRIPYLGHSHTP